MNAPTAIGRRSHLMRAVPMVLVLTFAIAGTVWALPIRETGWTASRRVTLVPLKSTVADLGSYPLAVLSRTTTVPMFGGIVASGHVVDAAADEIALGVHHRDEVAVTATNDPNTVIIVIDVRADQRALASRMSLAVFKQADAFFSKLEIPYRLASVPGGVSASRARGWLVRPIIYILAIWSGAIVVLAWIRGRRSVADDHQVLARAASSSTLSSP